MDVSEIRRLNLLLLMRDFKKQSDFADKIDKPASYISQLKKGEANGKKINMGNDIARHIELVFDLPYGWMDNLHGVGIDSSHGKPLNSTEEKYVLKAIESLSNVLVDYDENDNDSDGFVPIPIYDVIFCCGDGNNADFEFENVKGYRKFSPEFFKDKGIKSENFKLLCASNDSQSPYINDGDTVGIDISHTEIKDGEMYALLLDGERMFKQIFREGGGVLRLHSYNPQYPDKIIDKTNGESLKIVGKQIYREG